MLRIPNFRDVGGFYSEKYKKSVKDSLLYRSPSIHLASTDDLLLLNNNIFTIIDLRSEYEVQNEGNGNLTQYKNLYYHNIPLLTSSQWKVDPIGSKDSENLEGLSYFRYLNNEIALYNIFDKIIGSIDKNHGVIFHCAFGKDRTGIIAAIIQDLLGIDRITIAKEFAKSSIYLHELLDKYKGSETYNRDLSNISINHMETKEKSILDFFDLLYKKYGNSDNFLKNLSIKNNDISNFKNLMLN